MTRRSQRSERHTSLLFCTAAAAAAAAAVVIVKKKEKTVLRTFVSLQRGRWRPACKKKETGMISKNMNPSRLTLVNLSAEKFLEFQNENVTINQSGS